MSGLSFKGFRIFEQLHTTEPVWKAFMQIIIYRTDLQLLKQSFTKVTLKDGMMTFTVVYVLQLPNLAPEIRTLTL